MNSDIASAKPHVLAALRKANNVIGISDVHGWPRPQGYVDALAMLNAVREAERTNPALPPTPVKPKDIQKWIDSSVEVRHQESTRRDVIDELVLEWERNTARAGLAATADINSRLVAAFDELVKQFDSRDYAVRNLTGHEPPEGIEQHTAALRTASEMSNALMMRATIADAAQEYDEVGPDLIWLVLYPRPETTRDQVNDALQSFKDRTPQTLGEWDQLRPLGLRLAQVGEVGSRRQRHTDFMYQMSMSTPDLGVADHSYSEFEETPSGVPYGRRILGESDAIFDRQQSISL